MLVAIVIAPGTPACDDDVGFLLVVARIEDREDLLLRRHVVAAVKRGEGVRIVEVVLLPAFLAQHLGQAFGFLDRGRADQNRLAALLALLEQCR